MKLFYIFQILLLLLLFSCNEESVTEVKKDIEEEEVHISDLIPPFNIHEVKPDYTFWNHLFKITLKYDKYSDSIKTNFYFNKRKLNPIEKERSGDFVFYTFLTPGNAISDSLEVRYYEEDDSISIYSRMFEVVNSEIKVDSVSLINLNIIKVYLNNYKYKDYLTVSFKDSITKGFESRYNYINASPNYSGIFGELIDESYLLFQNSYVKSFALRIEAKEEINKSKQLHSYDYIYKSQKDIINNNITDNELKIGIVDSYYGNDDYIYLKFKNLYKIEYINKLIFENNEVNKWDLKFKPYIKESKEDNITEELAELKFPKPKKVRFGVVNLFYSDGNDTTFKIDFGFKNLFQSVKVDISNINIDFENFNMVGDFQYILDTLSTKYLIEKEGKKLNINYHYDNQYNSDKTYTSIKDSNNIAIIGYEASDSLTLNDLEEDLIDFEIKLHYLKAMRGLKSEIIVVFKYKGLCIKSENEKEIILLIDRSRYKNLFIEGNFKYYEYDSGLFIQFINGYSKPNFLFDNNSYIKLTFEK